MFLLAISIIAISPAASQGILNKLNSSVSKAITGTKDNSPKVAPEPKCACANAALIMDLGGKFKITYNEMSVYMKDDGSLLVYDKMKDKYYISKNGVAEGPYGSEDKIVKEFQSAPGSDMLSESDQPSGNSEQKNDYWLNKYPSFISRSGEKYLIKINGKSYGPFAQINDFAVPASKDKFAALVIENVLVTEDQGKKLEEAMKNAKTDQERMELSMKFSQQMSEKMKDGGAESITPKLVSNIPDVKYDAMQWMGGKLNGTAKFDDIVVFSSDKVIDLQGKTIFNLKNNAGTGGKFMINSSNSKYASYKYGTLTFSDGTTLSELFSPFLTKKDGKVYIAYLYYSPGRNSIMQCLIPF